MTKEEYKTFILFVLLDMNVELGPNIKWLAVDGDSGIWGYCTKPSLFYDSWIVRTQSLYHEFLFRLDFNLEFDWKESLITVGELFDE